MFGISIPQSCSASSDFIKSIDRDLLQCIELQGDLIQDAKLLDAVNISQLYLINSYDYIKNSTIVNSLEQPEIFHDEVIATINSLLGEKQYAILENVTIDFGLLKDSEQEKTFKFIKNLYYKIFQSGKNICLPVTIPGMEQKEEIIRTAFYKLMLSNFRVCLNIYPHEIGRDEDFSGFINAINLRTSLIRICYDAMLGNYITDNLLMYWRENFVKYELNCPVLFAPSVSNIEMIEHETKNIYELLKNIK
ncbi:MAG TPA: hypothetical protein DD381_05215 [Lentisphaeria bacterium]|nr:MAG: hypothetical protein A2X47_06200 [Lentisphaerae bacterium GWF2_38_69]HBM15731.1 hypothetical protein [Lentisphaeria bacterium]